MLVDRLLVTPIASKETEQVSLSRQRRIFWRERHILNDDCEECQRISKQEDSRHQCGLRLHETYHKNELYSMRI